MPAEKPPHLDELLARNLGCSRSAARALCDEGRVADAAGTLLEDGRVRLVPNAGLHWAVRIDERPVTLRLHALVLQNKPAGVITALHDARHDTAYELLREAPLHPHLRPVGRLDLDTTGLLLWTTDGQLISRLTHPKRGVPRTYHAALARAFTPPPEGFALEDGHRPNIQALTVLDGAAACHPALTPQPDATCWASITVIGGVYHEVRRIFAALGSHVLALCRVSYGPYHLPEDLPGAGFRVLDEV